MTRTTRTLLAAIAPLLSLLLASPGAAGVRPETALAAHRQLEAWVRDWSIPDDAIFDLGDEASAVSVTLLMGGAVVGRATVMGAGPDTLRAAAQQAWAEANQRIAVERDALRRERLLEAAQRLRVEIEIAGPLTPLFGATITDAAADVSPGRHGVAARAGSRLEGVFPGVMLATNTAPTQAMRSALASLGFPLEPLAELRETTGVILYRFDSVHLTQLTPGGAPIFLTRGGRTVPMSAVTAASLRDFADGVARHIASRRWPGDEPMGLMGVYRPWTGDYEDPIVAHPREQALAALALARWSRAARAESAAERLDAAREIILDLADIHENEIDPASDAAASAIVLLALREAYDARADETPLAVAELRDRAAARVRAAFDATDGFAPSLSPAERATVACAWAAEFDDPAPTRRLFRDTPPPALPDLMPWIGWAELLLHPEHDHAAVPAGVALENFRTLVWRHQLRAHDLDPGDADLAGGVVFTGARNPLPTAQTLRPLAFIATMLGDARLTPDEDAARELASLAPSLRFIMQLAAGEAEGNMYLDPSRAGAGVRNALWDQRMRLEASAMALLTLSETLRSIERRTPRPRDANNQ